MQKPQDLQRSTTIETRPFATGPPLESVFALPYVESHYAFLPDDVM